MEQQREKKININKKKTYLPDIEQSEAVNYFCDVSVHDPLSQDSHADDVLVSDLVSKQSMDWEFLPEEKQAMSVKRSNDKFATEREWSLQKKGRFLIFRFRVDETREGSKAQRIGVEDRREVLAISPKAKAVADTNVVVVGNPFRLFTVLGSN